MAAVIALWAIVVAAAALVSAWAIMRKRLASIPLVIGVWLLLLTGYLAMAWFPPTPGKLAALGLLAGFSITCLIWGLVNVAIERMGEIYKCEKVVLKDKAFKIAVYKPAEAHYGVLYGAVPWNEGGATFFWRFINENVWSRGLKITQLEIGLDLTGSIAWAWIWGLVEPKNILDRILY